MSLPADTSASHKTSELTPTKWTSGDFTLISSDNHIFKVDSYYLQAASSVFRHDTHVDMVIKRIEFTDDTLETALIIGHFLDLITTGKLEENLGRSTHLEKEFGNAPDSEYNTAMLYDLCNFLIKYDCLKEISILLQHISCRVMKNQIEFLPGFLLAAISDQPAECVAFLKAHAERPHVWQDHVRDHRTKHDVSGRDLLDPRAMPFAFYRRIPTDYLWALTMAWDIHAQDETREVAEEFGNLIKLLKKKE